LSTWLRSDCPEAKARQLSTMIADQQSKAEAAKLFAATLKN